MPTVYDPAVGGAMDGAVNESDVVMNRLNVALARSQKLINSWLPPRADDVKDDDNNGEGRAANGNDNDEEKEEEEEEDFKPMTEYGGIGSKVAFDDGTPSSDGTVLRGKRLTVNDKLLEQLIGKKAARERRKSREVANKSMSTSKHAAPRPVVGRPTGFQRTGSEDSDADEGGRAAAFKSRRPKKAMAAVLQTGAGGAQSDADGVVDGGEQRGEIAGTEGTRDVGGEEERPTRAAVDPGSDERRAKKRPGSYLDELLAQKASERSKKKSGRRGRVETN